jgi:hypothetical protein
MAAAANDWYILLLKVSASGQSKSLQSDSIFSNAMFLQNLEWLGI